MSEAEGDRNGGVVSVAVVGEEIEFNACELVDSEVDLFRGVSCHADDGEQGPVFGQKKKVFSRSRDDSEVFLVVAIDPPFREAESATHLHVVGVAAVIGQMRG